MGPIPFSKAASESKQLNLSDSTLLLQLISKVALGYREGALVTSRYRGLMLALCSVGAGDHWGAAGLGPGFWCPQLTPAVALTCNLVLFILLRAWGLLSSWLDPTVAFTEPWAPLNRYHIVHLAPDQEVQAVGSPHHHHHPAADPWQGCWLSILHSEGAKRGSGMNTASFLWPP